MGTGPRSVCPKCGKSNVGSNYINTHSAIHGTVHNLGKHGNPVILGIAGAAWLVGEAINLASESHVCDDCGHKFTPPPPPEDATQPDDSDDFDLFDF